MYMITELYKDDYQTSYKKYNRNNSWLFVNPLGQRFSKFRGHKNCWMNLLKYRSETLIRDSNHVIQGETPEAASLTSIPDNPNATLSILTNKILNTLQVIIVKDHPPLLTPAVLDYLQFLEQTMIYLSQDFYINSSLSRNDFPILLGPTPTSSSSVNCTSPGEFPASAD